MTTKYKIISGFFVMVLIQAAIAVLGYVDLQRSSDGFREYRRLARFNLNMSDMETAMYAAAFETYRFIDNQEPQNIDAAKNFLRNAVKKITEAGEFVQRPDRKAVLAKLNSDADAMQNGLDIVKQRVVSSYNQYEATSGADAAAMQKYMQNMAAQAHSVDNTDALLAISDTWKDFSNVLTCMGRYVDSRDPADGKATTDAAAAMGASLDKVGPLLRTAEGKKNFDDLKTAYGKLSQTLTGMTRQTQEAGKALADMNSLVAGMIEDCDKLNASVNEQMLDTGTKLLSSNESAQSYMLMLSAIGLLVGIACAIFIVYGIIRVLSALAGFADAVARGDFSHPLNVREGGEIGKMVAGMRQIPMVLNKVMDQAIGLGNGIMSGKFRERLHDEDFTGSFSDLSKAVNSLCDAYTDTIDALPLPMMTADKNYSMLFLNKIAQAVIGGNFVTEKCSAHLNATDCDSARCFGRRAMEGGKPYTDETTLVAKGNRIEASVTAVPLRDAKNATVGYMEMITDLTEMKNRQTVTLNVAREAATIADRVAAASEELSAQVEQVSRGADMQRSRVESTASAMTEMNATVLEVARNAGQASDQSDGTRQKAEDGAGLVNQVVKAINNVNTVAVGLQDNMQELGKQAESIGGVMNVISDIADQTNLLALNAAIEAARAGEAGRGFAVVADEVRKLAEKTMSATQEVGASITAIQHSARANIGEVGNAVKSISEATSLANSSGEALKEIVDLSAANSSVVASIATAAEEQSATSEEINRAIDEISHIVAETSDGMMQSSAAVQELSQMAQELRRVMDGLK